MSPTDLSKPLCAASKTLSPLIRLSALGLCLCEDGVCQRRIITVNKSPMTCDYLSIVLHLLSITASELKKQKNKHVASDYLLFFLCPCGLGVDCTDLEVQAKMSAFSAILLNQFGLDLMAFSLK